MSQEITVRQQLTIGVLDYRGVGPTAIIDDMDGRFGPTPGSLMIDTDGTDVTLLNITTPGWCEFVNQEDPADDVAGGDMDGWYVEVGIRDIGTGYFYPLAELRPGKKTIIPLSRNLTEAYTGAGTGTTAAINPLHVRATGGTQRVFVGAFER